MSQNGASALVRSDYEPDHVVVPALAAPEVVPPYFLPFAVLALTAPLPGAGV